MPTQVVIPQHVHNSAPGKRAARRAEREQAARAAEAKASAEKEAAEAKARAEKEACATRVEAFAVAILHEFNRLMDIHGDRVLSAGGAFRVATALKEHEDNVAEEVVTAWKAALPIFHLPEPPDPS